MGFLRRIFSREAPHGLNRESTPGQLLDYLETGRQTAEQMLFTRHRACPECDSDDLRVGAWASNGRAGWTITCINCGHMLERTVEVTVR
jgi:hypothetical protein